MNKGGEIYPFVVYMNKVTLYHKYSVYIHKAGMEYISGNKLKYWIYRMLAMFYYKLYLRK